MSASEGLKAELVAAATGVEPTTVSEGSGRVLVMWNSLPLASDGKHYKVHFHITIGGEVKPGDGHIIDETRGNSESMQKIGGIPGLNDAAKRAAEAFAETQTGRNINLFPPLR